jgi:hypothetical protein
VANYPSEGKAMRRKRRKTVAPVFVDPNLERRWQEALLTRPTDQDPAALAAWNRDNGEVVVAYDEAVERARRQQRKEGMARTKRRRRITAAVIGTLLAISGIAYWATRPSEDEVRREATLHRDAVCTTHYEQTHHLKMMGTQVDLLQDGEGGWLELHPYSQPTPVGGVVLSPAELLAGKTSEAQVNRESYVFDSSIGVGPWALVERQEGRLTLTLFSMSGFYDLPHAPLQASTASAVTVRGEKVSPECF